VAWLVAGALRDVERIRLLLVDLELAGLTGAPLRPGALEGRLDALTARLREAQDAVD
jgi:hypothetical protein